MYSWTKILVQVYGASSVQYGCYGYRGGGKHCVGRKCAHSQDLDGLQENANCRMCHNMHGPGDAFC